MNIKSNFKKIIILVLVTILISSNTLHAAKFKWTKIIASVDDDEFYLDKNSIYKVHGRNLKIYDDILGDLIKNRKIKVK